MMLRGKDNVSNVKLLCRQGGAVERRMVAECEAAEKSMAEAESGGGCCGGCCGGSSDDKDLGRKAIGVQINVEGKEDEGDDVQSIEF